MDSAMSLVGRSLNKAYGAHRVLVEVDVELAAGTVTAIVGPNGAGKSTLLRCLAGAERLDSGQVELDGCPCDPNSVEHWRAILSILDDHAWLPDLTVRDHLLLSGNSQKTEEALATMELGPLADRLPALLSAGQRQRAALAIAWVRPWRVLLLDEPERHLDVEGVALLTDLVRAFPDRAVALATHSLELVARTDATVLPIG